MTSTAYMPILRPPDLRLDDEAHKAYIGAREVLRVTSVLDDVGLVGNKEYFTPESRLRGSYIHDAIKIHHEGDLDERSIDGALSPFWDGYLEFRSQSQFIPELVEEPIGDAVYGYAGRFDLFGRFPELPDDAKDLIDVKTGVAPLWVRLQTMAYRRCIVVGRVRRWVLQLGADGHWKLMHLNLVKGTYRVDREADRRHEKVFLSALYVSQFKRGWIE